MAHAADLPAFGQFDGACVEVQFAPYQFEKSGFPRPIAAHNANFMACGNDGGGVVYEDPPFDRITDVI